MTATRNLRLIPRPKRRRELVHRGFTFVAALTVLGLIVGGVLLRFELFSVATGKERVGGTLLLALLAVGLALGAAFVLHHLRVKLAEQRLFDEASELQQLIRPAEKELAALRDQRDRLPVLAHAIGLDFCAEIDVHEEECRLALDAYTAGQQDANSRAAPDLRLERDELLTRIRHLAQREKNEITSASREKQAEIEGGHEARLTEARAEGLRRIYPAPVLAGLRLSTASIVVACLIAAAAVGGAVTYVTGIYPPYDNGPTQKPMDPDAALFPPENGP